LKKENTSKTTETNVDEEGPNTQDILREERTARGGRIILKFSTCLLPENTVDTEFIRRSEVWLSRNKTEAGGLHPKKRGHLRKGRLGEKNTSQDEIWGRTLFEH